MTELWSRFVVSQVPKSEAPGAPIFLGLMKVSWVRFVASHTGHKNKNVGRVGHPEFLVG
jgi:hypothetical protein